MNIFRRIVFLLLCLSFFNCNHSTEKQKDGIESRKVDVKYQAFVKRLKSKNLDLCQLKEMRLNIKKNAQILADKKYPNSIAQHEKYIERIVGREIDTVLKDYNLETQDWILAWRYSNKYCK
jgi:hypothetical protein